jgi:hypothetical protein
VKILRRRVRDDFDRERFHFCTFPLEIRDWKFGWARFYTRGDVSVKPHTVIAKSVFSGAE